MNLRCSRKRQPSYGWPFDAKFNKWTYLCSGKIFIFNNATAFFFNFKELHLFNFKEHTYIHTSVWICKKVPPGIFSNSLI